MNSSQNKASDIPADATFTEKLSSKASGAVQGAKEMASGALFAAKDALGLDSSSKSSDVASDKLDIDNSGPVRESPASGLFVEDIKLHRHNRPNVQSNLDSNIGASSSVDKKF